MIRFEKITKNNFTDCINIDTGIDQSYLKPVVYQIALNHVCPTKIPLAICEDRRVIGFVSYEKDMEPEIAYDILVFVIDKNLQGRGLGKKALNAFIEYLQRFDDCKVITLNYNENNTPAYKLYSKAGFKRTGGINENNSEVVMRLEV